MTSSSLLSSVCLPAASKAQQTAPSAADACPAVAALGIRLALVAVVEGRPDTVELADGLQSCMVVVRSCVACRLAPSFVAWAVVRHVILQVSRQLIRHPRHWHRLVRVHSDMPARSVSHIIAKLLDDMI